MNNLVFYAGMLYDEFSPYESLPVNIPDGAYFRNINDRWWKKVTTWEAVDKDEVPKELKALILLLT